MCPDKEDPDTLDHARRAKLNSQSPSWGPLTKKIRDSLARFTATKLPPRLDHEDFGAEVMLRILRDLPNTQIRTRGEFWSWLNTVADHTLTDLWRHSRAKKRGSEQEIPVDDENRPIEIEGLEPAASGVHRANEIALAEQSCISSLPTERGRRTYSLRRRHEMTFEEIAARTGQGSAAAARYIFFRMKENVRACLRTKLETGYANFFEQLDEATP